MSILFIHRKLVSINIFTIISTFLSKVQLIVADIPLVKFCTFSTVNIAIDWVSPGSLSGIDFCVFRDIFLTGRTTIDTDYPCLYLETVVSFRVLDTRKSQSGHKSRRTDGEIPQSKVFVLHVGSTGLVTATSSGPLDTTSSFLCPF